MSENSNVLKHRSYNYAIKIVGLMDKLNNNDYSVQIIAKQLLRSATSIGANIAEAQAGSSRKDFINFYHYALKSANETKFWLGLLRDTKKYNGNEVDKLLIETHELANMLGASIITLRNKNRE